MPERTNADIASYYDVNTHSFLRFGGGGSVAAIHRQIWGPGVRNREQAFLYANNLVAESLRPALSGLDESWVLDLGCGVGGTAIWLAQQLGIQVIGVTNSPVQAKLARQRAILQGLEERCRFLTADFHDLPFSEPIAAALAIESFVHANNPEIFFQQAARLVAPGGRLVLCDDFLDMQGQTSHSSRSWVTRFRNGWHLPNLLTVDQALTAATLAGWQLVSIQNLSSYVRSWPAPVLHLMAALTNLPLPWMYWDNLRGGSALQICSKKGWIQYHTITWKRLE